MREWHKTRLQKAQGDPWTVPDANAWPRSSRQAVQQWLREHDEWGRHLPPAPVAAAVAWWDGSNYDIWAMEGIAEVRHISTGLLELELEEPMADLNYVATGMATLALPEQVPLWVFEDRNFVRDTRVTRIQIMRMSIPYEHELSRQWVRDPQPVDASVIIEVWGESL